MQAYINQKGEIMKDTFYITTPIYYPSNKLTLGNCYTTVVCDSLARFNRMCGKDVFYLTGTDEHGQKIEKKALACGKPEMEYLNEIIDDTKALWKMLDISYDKFIRTTDDYHVKTVQKIFSRLYEKGQIYKSSYKGLYCTPCESFWTEEQLIDGKCPDCGRPVEPMEEEAYFFRLSDYQNKILDLYKTNPNFLRPQSRVNEMVNNFIKPGLKDLCVSRTSVKWGVPVEFDPKHTIYVWIDALPNYLSALGYLQEDDKNFNKFWPADVHVVGKEIVRFHAIIWPAILMALDLPLPKQIYGHGWLLFGNDKLSKSKETGKKEVIDPRVLVARYGLDSVRLFLTKEIQFGQDGPYSQDLFLNAFNTNLANEYGNLVSRTCGMIGKYLNGTLNKAGELTEIDNAFVSEIRTKRTKVFEQMEDINPSGALNTIFEMFSRTNKYIDETAPWVLFKENNTARINTVMNLISEAIIIANTLLLPFLTDKPKMVYANWGLKIPTSFNEYDDFGFIADGTPVVKGENLYQRLDINKEIAELNDIANK